MYTLNRPAQYSRIDLVAAHAPDGVRPVQQLTNLASLIYPDNATFRCITGGWFVVKLSRLVFTQSRMCCIATYSLLSDAGQATNGCFIDMNWTTGQWALGKVTLAIYCTSSCHGSTFINLQVKFITHMCAPSQLLYMYKRTGAKGRHN
jgi:hypothetical protein